GAKIAVEGFGFLHKSIVSSFLHDSDQELGHTILDQTPQVSPAGTGFRRLGLFQAQFPHRALHQVGGDLASAGFFDGARPGGPRLFGRQVDQGPELGFALGSG
ncbi:MAG TPA: hypothetical protein VG167_11725, partial [Verrucomicrobiae bacterium]|nr:hypothetical protein [Verrucomicrobiae bacterium]